MIPAGARHPVPLQVSYRDIEYNIIHTPAQNAINHSLRLHYYLNQFHDLQKARDYLNCLSMIQTSFFLLVYFLD